MTPEHDSIITREHAGVYLIMGPTLGLFNRENVSPRLSYDQTLNG